MVDCFVDLSLLVDIAAIRGSYKPPLEEGFIFGNSGKSGEQEGNRSICHIKSALAWPISDPARMSEDDIIQRIGHVCLTRKDFKCLGVWQVHNKEKALPSPLLSNVPYPLEVCLEVEASIFDVLESSTDKHQRVKQQSAAADSCSTLDLLSKMCDDESIELKNLLIRVISARTRQPLIWTLRADYPSFILYESLFNMDKLHSNIATTLPTFPDDRTTYSDAEVRRLVDVVYNHHSKANQLFLNNALTHVGKCLEDVEHNGDILVNDNIDPVLLRQIQFCVKELAALKQKQSCEETQSLLRVLQKAICLAQLSYQESRRLCQSSANNKYKVPKRERAFGVSSSSWGYEESTTLMKDGGPLGRMMMNQ